MNRRWIRPSTALLVILGLGLGTQAAWPASQGDQDQGARLNQKMKELQSTIGKRPCVNMQGLAEIMHGYEPLVQQHKLTEAEALLDRALDLINKPASAKAETGPSPSLGQKMQQIQALVQKRQQAGGDMQPVGEMMEGFQSLMERQKYGEAEALLDRVLAFLNGTAPAEAPGSDETPLIAYASCDTNGQQQIFVVEPDGTGKQQLTQEGKQNFFPAWSPDGKSLAFTSDRAGSYQIWVMDADGDNPRELTTSFEGENVVPTWSPDGKRLAFASNRTGHFEIWVMAADGNHQKQLTKTDATVGNNAAAWSPDGRKIAFSSTKSGHYAIWTIDPDGGHLTQLTTPYGDRYPDANAPAWSPDGTKIAFWSGLEHKYGNVWVMNADGSERKELTHEPPSINCDEAAWSADGREIMFASNRPGSEGIGNWIMDSDGRNPRVLMTNTNVRGRPAWQPKPEKY